MKKRNREDDGQSDLPGFEIVEYFFDYSPHGETQI